MDNQIIDKILATNCNIGVMFIIFIKEAQDNIVDMTPNGVMSILFTL